jgi:serine/threonine-protein kinase
VGDVLAKRYRVDGVLGAGGMSSVYLATDLRLERQVAVKVLLSNLARDAEVSERFDREARMLAAVAHPSIAEIFDVEQGDPATGREPFYVMELCEGGSLAARIETAGPLEPGELVPLILVIAAALGELHSHGLIHRDVKPANILFTGGRPKLADFGLARPGSGFEALTQPGTAMGTPAYMAPELVGGGAATTASDVYALGATTFHGLTGRAPRPGSSLTGLAASLAEDVPLISVVSLRLGTAFDSIVANALSRDPVARPSLGAYSAGLVASLGPVGALVESPTAVDWASETTRIVLPEPPTRVARILPVPVRAAEGRLANVIPLALMLIAVLAIPAALAVWPEGANRSDAAALLPSGPASLSPVESGSARSSAPAPTTSAPSASASGTSTPPSAPAPATATPTAVDRALSALEDVETAIDQAKGGKGGLKGGDARELESLAGSVHYHLVRGEFQSAQAAAEKLLEKAGKADKGHSGEILVQSIEQLLAVIPA